MKGSGHQGPSRPLSDQAGVRTPLFENGGVEGRPLGLGFTAGQLSSRRSQTERRRAFSVRTADGDSLPNLAFVSNHRFTHFRHAF